MSLTPIPEQYLPYSFVGPASIPIKQHINNGMTTAYMGMPFKPDTMTQGSDFSRARRVYSRVDRFKTKTSVDEKKAEFVRVDDGILNIKEDGNLNKTFGDLYPPLTASIGDYYKVTDPSEIVKIKNQIINAMQAGSVVSEIYKNNNKWFMCFINISGSAPYLIVFEQKFMEESSIRTGAALQLYINGTPPSIINQTILNNLFANTFFIRITINSIAHNSTTPSPQFINFVSLDNITKNFQVSQALPIQKQFTSSEERIAMRKMEAIGKSSMKQGMPRRAPLSFRSQERNSRNSALAKVRGGGAVAPKKKGAIANSFKSG